MRTFSYSCICALFLVCAVPARAQSWGGINGTISESVTKAPLPGATVTVDGTNFGSAAGSDGRYSLRIPAGRYLLTFTALGFGARQDSVIVTRGQNTVLDVVLEVQPIRMAEITIEDAAAPVEAGVHAIKPEDVRALPGPFKDVVRALKVLPGVAANNELSNQYSVRGGGYNENLLFVNGFEVYLPFRPRQGEQEGLSLLNPDLTDKITFYSGGFPARYGGKLSSALDVEYLRPFGDPLTGSAHLSLLDAGVSARASGLGGRLAWNAGIRKARASHFFATQELKGSYEPDYTDVQGLVSYRPVSGHTVEALWMLAHHEFALDPNSRKTFFGTISQNSLLASSNLKSVWTTFDDDNEERDGYQTDFVGLRIANDVSSNFRVDHRLSMFSTAETERFDISGSTIVYLADPGAEDPQQGEGLIPTGASREESFADNEVQITTWTGEATYSVEHDLHALEGGWFLRSLTFDDRIDEKAVIVGPSLEGDIVRIVVDSLRDSARLSTHQAGFYLQDTVRLRRRPGSRLTLTGGLRADYYDLNGEWTWSPRLSVHVGVSERTKLLGSWGVYYQAPTYRELRGKPAPGETILGAINRDIKSQRSMQFVAGVEHFLVRRRLYARAEVYLKEITNAISYDIENVRVSYSGENDARATTYGIDLQLRGELVPGMESWLNYSMLYTRERFLDAFQNESNGGTSPRPTDQRHTVSLYIQDYIPNDPSWRLHMRTLFGSGLPYTPPIPGEQIGNIVTQVSGDRYSARFPRYFRFDMGVTKSMTVFQSGLSGPVKLALTGEVLNIFNMVNTVAYTWVPDNEGIWNRVPTRLTPRTVNVRARLTF